jgi:uncharacterized DUF497 family protein
MEFEWSESKRRLVLEARGLDFIAAGRMFDGRPLYTLPSPRDDEERWLSIGELDGHLVAVVWTLRGAATRIITMRMARHAEKRRYRALFG